MDALLVLPDPFMEGHLKQIVEFTHHAAIPAMFSWREYVEAGGLMSYGTKLADSYRQAGVYVGRVLNGERPSELPIALPTKFEFLLNIAAAKKLGLQILPALLALADEVIE
jgi:putative tryptophan/tyrosine transport system substrate-binding protein